MSDSKIELDEKLEFRRATGDDFEGIMKLSENVYDGMDYLPAQYHDFSRDPLMYLYIAIRETIIIGFMIVNVTDFGRTITHKALRVDRQFEGKGYMRQLRSFAQNDVLQIHDHVNRIVTTAVDPKPHLKAMLTNNDYHLIVIRGRLTCVIKLSKMCASLESVKLQHHLKDVQILDKSSAVDLLINKIDLNYFLKEKNWFINWDVYENNAHNLYRVLENTHLFVTFNDVNGQIEAISFFTSIRVPFGWKVRVDFYNHYDLLDHTIMLSHTLKQLQYIKDNIKDDIEHLSYGILYNNNYIGGTLIKQFLISDLGFQEAEIYHQIASGLAFEKFI